MRGKFIRQSRPEPGSPRAVDESHISVEMWKKSRLDLGNQDVADICRSKGSLAMKKCSSTTLGSSYHNPHPSTCPLPPQPVSRHQPETDVPMSYPIIPVRLIVHLSVCSQGGGEHHTHLPRRNDLPQVTQQPHSCARNETQSDKRVRASTAKLCSGAVGQMR